MNTLIRLAPMLLALGAGLAIYYIATREPKVDKKK
jgi:hypothetical protein